MYKPRGQNFGQFWPPSPMWTLLLNSCVVVIWTTPLPSRLSAWFVHAPHTLHLKRLHLTLPGNRTLCHPKPSFLEVNRRGLPIHFFSSRNYEFYFIQWGSGKSFWTQAIYICIHFFKNQLKLQKIRYAKLHNYMVSCRSTFIIDWCSVSRYSFFFFCQIIAYKTFVIIFRCIIF